MNVSSCERSLSQFQLLPVSPFAFHPTQRLIVTGMAAAVELPSILLMLHTNRGLARQPQPRLWHVANCPALNHKRPIGRRARCTCCSNEAHSSSNPLSSPPLFSETLFKRACTSTDMDASFSDVASSPTLPSDDASDDRDAPGIASIAPTKPLSKSMNNNNKRARNSAERPPPKRIKIREKAAAKVKVEEDGEVDAQRLRAAEEEEQRLLAGGGRVQSRVSEGRIVQQSQQPSNADIAAEWLEIQKRVRKDRIAKVGGTTIAAYISSLTQKVCCVTI